MKKTFAFGFLWLSVVSIFFMSCHTRLGVNPAFDIPEGRALEDTTALQEALESAYGALQSEWCYGAAFIVYPEILADHVKPRDAGMLLQDADIYHRRMTPFTEGVNKTWEWAYKAINRANIIIDAVENNKVAGLSANEKNRFLGEALFIRAISHFELVRLYAPQYDATTLSLSAIPLRTTPAVSKEGSAFATVEQVYQQVIKDLERAANLLPPPLRSAASDRFFGRADRDAAKAFLALVHFQKGTAEGYAAALPLLDEVLGVDENFVPTNLNAIYPPNYPIISSFYPGSTLMNVFDVAGRRKPIVANDPDRFEIIFMIMNVGRNNTYTHLLDRFGYFVPPKYNYPAPGVPLLPQYIFSDSAKLFIDKYAKLNVANIATRFDRRIRDEQNAQNLVVTPFINGEYYTNKYSRQIAGNVLVIRAAELLLMRAEIHARNGNLSAAVRDVAPIVRRALRLNVFLAPNAYYSSLQSLNQDELLAEIQRERVRELNFEGKRLHDLRRRRANVGPGNRGGTSLSWNATELILPIPHSETSTNKNLR